MLIAGFSVAYISEKNRLKERFRNKITQQTMPIIEQYENNLNNLKANSKSKNKRFFEIYIDGKKIFKQGRLNRKEHIDQFAVQGKNGATYQVKTIQPKIRPAVRQLLQSLLSIQMLLITLVAALISWWLSILIIRPISILAAVSEAISQGAETEKIPKTLRQRKDEIGLLANKLHQLIQHLRKLIDNEIVLMPLLSHELSAPLARIQASLGLMSQTGTINQINEIEKECDWMQHILRTILSLSYFEKQNDQPIAISANDFFSPIIKEKQRLYADYRIQFLRSNAEIKVNPSTMGIVIANLIDNACLHNPTGTHILLSTDETDTKYIVKIQDNGCIYSNDEIEHLLTPFIKSKQSTGLGLGLTLCKKIIEQAQGELQLSAIQPHGLLISIYLQKQNAR